MFVGLERPIAALAPPLELLLQFVDELDLHGHALGLRGGAVVPHDLCLVRVHLTRLFLKLPLPRR